MALLLAACCVGAAGAMEAPPGGLPTGKVVRVTDGDSLWWKPDLGGRPLRVRLQGIDAPEICQQGGKAAREQLAALVERRPVQLERLGLDDHGRVLGRLHTPAVPDVGARMVEQGHAWSYRFKADPGPYKVQESRAIAARRGLHKTAGAMEPRAFRLQHGPCR
jgi:micrococcal nuclease